MISFHIEMKLEFNSFYLNDLTCNITKMYLFKTHTHIPHFFCNNVLDDLKFKR